jgi:predicted ArsR family transcriptional regulator
MDLQKQSTRTAILNFLKINGSSEAKAMAAFCGLTTMAVRQHLLRLLADGLLQVRTERRPQGRPTHVYWLTELGDAQFPRDYAGLASDLLSTLAVLDGKAKIKEMFRKRRSEMMTRYRARVKGKDLEARVCETVSILTECGYMAKAVPSGSTEFLLTEHNCAIRDIAKCFCEEELCFIRDVVGARVTRVKHLLAGDRHCSYLIERNRQSQAGGRKKKV